MIRAVLKGVYSLAVAIAAALLFLVLAWCYSYPGRLYVCEQTLIARGHQVTAAERFCIDQVNP